MILAIDVQYGQNDALVAGVLFKDWASATLDHSVTKQLDQIAPYEPGQFYKRELPCIMALLADVIVEIDMIVVDGYVTLGENGKPGLGMHLYNALARKIPVIGVAKRAFHQTPAACELLRGESQTPLYVTAVGLPLLTAKTHIATMHGDYRIPTLLKKVDQLCRGIA